MIGELFSAIFEPLVVFEVDNGFVK